MRPEPHHLRVARTARYYLLGEPAAHAHELWVVCHGYGQLARTFSRRFQPIAAAHRVIAAPEALNRYYFDDSPGAHGPDARVGATWMTREDREHDIADYVDYLDAITAHIAAGMTAPRITALGFSQGSATVSRWAAAGSTRLDRVILWGGSVAHDIGLHADVFRGTPLVLVAGRSDEQLTAARLAAETTRLHDAGIQPTIVHYDGGHHIDETALRGLASDLRT